AETGKPPRRAHRIRHGGTATYQPGSGPVSVSTSSRKARRVDDNNRRSPPREQATERRRPHDDLHRDDGPGPVAIFALSFALVSMNLVPYLLGRAASTGAPASLSLGFFLTVCSGLGFLLLRRPRQPTPAGSRATSKLTPDEAPEALRCGEMRVCVSAEAALERTAPVPVDVSTSAPAAACPTRISGRCVEDATSMRPRSV